MFTDISKFCTPHSVAWVLCATHSAKHAQHAMLRACCVWQNTRNAANSGQTSTSFKITSKTAQTLWMLQTAKKTVRRKASETLTTFFAGRETSKAPPSTQYRPTPDREAFNHKTLRFQVQPARHPQMRPQHHVQPLTNPPGHAQEPHERYRCKTTDNNKTCCSNPPTACNRNYTRRRTKPSKTVGLGASTKCLIYLLWAFSLFWRSSERCKEEARQTTTWPTHAQQPWGVATKSANQEGNKVARSGRKIEQNEVPKPGPQNRQFCGDAWAYPHRTAIFSALFHGRGKQRKIALLGSSANEGNLSSGPQWRRSTHRAVCAWHHRLPPFHCSMWRRQIKVSSRASTFKMAARGSQVLRPSRKKLNL